MTAAAGAGSGSLTIGWIAKVLISRFIKENDSKHRITAEAMRSISKSYEKQNIAVAEKLSRLDTSLEIIKARMGEVMNVREDVITQGRELAVLQTEVKAAQKDIDEGFQATRKRTSELDKEITGLHKIMVQAVK